MTASGCGGRSRKQPWRVHVLVEGAEVNHRTPLRGLLRNQEESAVETRRVVSDWLYCTLDEKILKLAERLGKQRVSGAETQTRRRRRGEGHNPFQRQVVAGGEDRQDPWIISYQGPVAGEVLKATPDWALEELDRETWQRRRGCPGRGRGRLLC